MRAEKTIRYGDREVPVIDRSSWHVAEKQPYRKTYSLKPGQQWRNADVTPAQWESYVVIAGEAVPVGAAIARELLDDGALAAVFTEMWGGLVLVNADLVCVQEQGPIGEVLERIRLTTGGKLGGLPDVVSVFPDGKIAMREAKNIAAKDRLGAKQHELAKVMWSIFGDKLDLAVVEWGARAAA